MATRRRPTMRDILGNTLAELNGGREKLGDARDWLVAADPADGVTAEFNTACRDARELIGEAKELIDRAKGVLTDAMPEDPED